MDNRTIKMAKAKVLSYGIVQAKIYQCVDGIWMAGFLFNSPPEMPDHPLFLATTKGELRLFKTADEAIKAVKEVTLDETEIVVDWEGRDRSHEDF